MCYVLAIWAGEGLCGIGIPLGSPWSPDYLLSEYRAWLAEYSFYSHLCPLRVTAWGGGFAPRVTGYFG